MLVYKIFDTKDKCYLKGCYKSRKNASKQADKLDLQYGAVRYVVFSEEISDSQILRVEDPKVA